MNLDHIKTFLAVYRAGSFVEVAKNQNLAPSSISRSIATLESLLKTRLFQRTTRNLTPTQAGEAYFEKILPLVEEIDLIHQLLLDSSASPSGRLRVTASVSYGEIMIAPKLKKFRALFPKIELELILSDGFIDIINDQIDVAIRHGSLTDSSLISRKLADAKYHLVASPTYIKKYGKPQCPEDLQSHELVTFAYENFRHEWTFSTGQSTQKIPVKAALTITNAAAIRECVRDGAGIAMLAGWTVEKDLRSGRLIELLPEWRISGASANTSVCLVYPSSRFLPAKTRAFAEFLINDPG